MTYQIRLSQPLIGNTWRKVLIKFFQGLFGFALFVFTVSWSIMLGSYSPYDPGVFNLNQSEGVSNLFGPTGAMIASRSIVVCGLGAWALSAFSLVWAVRFTFYSQTERFIKSLILFPILLALASAFAATLAPLNWWNHYFGLGGLFGDTVNGALLHLLFFSPETYLQFSSVIFGTLLLVVAFYAFGFSIKEIIHVIIASAKTKEKSPPASKPMTIQGSDPSESDVEMPVKNSLRARLANFFAQDENDPMADKEPDIYAKLSGEVTPSPPQNNKPNRVKQIFSSVWGLLEEKEPVIREKTHAGFNFTPKTNGLDGQSSQALNNPIHALDDQQQRDDDKPTFENGLSTSIKQSKRARQEAQTLPLDELTDVGAYRQPPLSLLNDPEEIFKNLKSQAELEENGEKLRQVLKDFSVDGKVERILQGPVITQYKFRPAAGVKTSRVIQLSDDIARLMSALTARVTTIPGEPYVGIELPAEKRETIYLKELAQSATFGDSNYTIPLIFGKDISGHPVVVDLATMPHLLIAGTTGSGKSVGLNSMILSMLYKLSPEQCKIMMIDPKMIELSGYDGIPHLVAPVITDPKKAIDALKWVTYEMNKRYEKMQNMRLNIKNIRSFNNHMQALKDKGETVYSIKVGTGYHKETNRPVFTEQNFDVEILPHIVVIIDELADLMQTAGKEIDACLQLLSQKARASGIHLIAATQRPSVDVINGIIKSNFPNRVSFQVSSKIDSRTILNTQGAEHLLGKGDMLFLSGGGRLQRVHGTYVSDEEVEKVVAYLKDTYGEQFFGHDIFNNPEEQIQSVVDHELGLSNNKTKENELYAEAVMVVKNDRRVSISYIQRKLSIGYNKAAKIIERMEDEKLISQPNNVGKREIYIPE